MFGTSIYVPKLSEKYEENKIRFLIRFDLENIFFNVEMCKEWKVLKVYRVNEFFSRYFKITVR